jgi:hypothetical protein
MRKLFWGVATLLVTAPLAAQDYQFTRDLRPGDEIELENINGSIEVRPTNGRTARVEVSKTVRRGDGNLVKVLVENEGRTMRVCTVYLNRDRNRNTCEGPNNLNRSERLEVTTDYVVLVPSGVEVDANTVNGSIVLRGIDTPSSASTVNGDIEFEAVGAHQLETVNGNIRASLARADWTGELEMQTVNGSIDLTLPESFAAQTRSPSRAAGDPSRSTAASTAAATGLSSSTRSTAASESGSCENQARDDVRCTTHRMWAQAGPDRWQLARSCLAPRGRFGVDSAA